MEDKIQKVKDGVLIPVDIYAKIGNSIADLSSRLYFLKNALRDIDENMPMMEQNPVYGLDVFMEDMQKQADNLYEELIDV